MWFIYNDPCAWVSPSIPPAIPMNLNGEVVSMLAPYRGAFLLGSNPGYSCIFFFTFYLLSIYLLS